MTTLTEERTQEINRRILFAGGSFILLIGMVSIFSGWVLLGAAAVETGSTAIIGAFLTTTGIVLTVFSGLAIRSSRE